MRAVLPPRWRASIGRRKLIVVRGCALVAASMLVAAAPAARGADFSTSLVNPTSVPKDGIISGTFSGGQTRYYFVLDAASGRLLTQISFGGSPGKDKELQLELLDSSARVAESYWVHGEEASAQSTRAFPIDAPGRRVLRVVAKGPETSRFCIELGGDAYLTEGGAACPALDGDAGKSRAETKAAAPPRVAEQIEVIESKCEQRLRIGSDVLFDFDSSEVRKAAAPTLQEIERRVAASSNPVTVEGHTDAKGSDGYNEELSLRRARAVEKVLEQTGIAGSRLAVAGYGEKRPVAPNEHTDGSDDPDGRQKNRRVEIVINTCS